MNLRPLFLALLLLLICYFPGLAQSQPLPASEIAKTDILILGTHHLSHMDKFEQQMLEQVLARLDQFDVDAICVEGMSLELLADIQAREDEHYAQVLTSFGGHRLKVAQQYQTLLGMDRLTAESTIDSLLSVKPLPPSKREDLIHAMLADGDIASATLHYLLMSSEQQAFHTLSSDTQELLKQSARRVNEIYRLAVQLAQREGIQRIDYIDDFQDEALLFKHFPHFLTDVQDQIELLQSVSQRPIYQQSDSLLRACMTQQDLLPFYDFLNSPLYQQQDQHNQWDLWLRTDFASKTDRARYSLWQMRNLQIAAHIAKQCAFYPEKRILVIIGAAHKPFLERYLAQLPDVRILPFTP